MRISVSFMALLSLGQLSANEGILEGVVVNATRGHAVAAGTEVILRGQHNGEFIPLAKTVTSAGGEFRFTGLPLDEVGPYLAGANRDGVHFPGPRVDVTAERPYAEITITVYDAVCQPNPLLIEHHEIVLHVESGAIRVRESIQINNPSSTCFVGNPSHAESRPITLSLGIPNDFERITFDKEAYGRRFQLVDGELVTGIPWPPGKRELAFSYVVPNKQVDRPWQRRIDLPCRRVSLRVRTDSADQIGCNLPSCLHEPDGFTYYESDEFLAIGDIVRIDVGGQGIPPLVYARWAAVTILVVLIVGLVLATLRRRRNASQENVKVSHDTFRMRRPSTI